MGESALSRETRNSKSILVLALGAYYFSNFFDLNMPNFFKETLNWSISREIFTIVLAAWVIYLSLNYFINSLHEFGVNFWKSEFQNGPSRYLFYWVIRPISIWELWIPLSAILFVFAEFPPDPFRIRAQVEILKESPVLAQLKLNQGDDLEFEGQEHRLPDGIELYDFSKYLLNPKGRPDFPKPNQCRPRFWIPDNNGVEGHFRKTVIPSKRKMKSEATIFEKVSAYDDLPPAYCGEPYISGITPFGVPAD